MSALSRSADHESGHAAAALLCGCRVLEIKVGGLADGTTGEIRWRRGPLTRIHLLVQLAGGLVAGRNGASDFGEWPPSWPVLPGRGDQGDVAATVKRLKLSEEDYDEVVRAAHALTATHEFRFLRLIIAAACKASEPTTLSEEQIEELVGDDFIHHYRNRS